MTIAFKVSPTFPPELRYVTVSSWLAHQRQRLTNEQGLVTIEVSRDSGSVKATRSNGKRASEVN